jgi:hypothetical protein
MWGKDKKSIIKQIYIIMKILHITPSSNRYEEVILLANKYSRKNSMAVIEKKGKIFLTGGFLINDTPDIRKVLDSIDKSKQYEFIKNFKQNPFAKFYYTDEEEI